MLKNLLGKLFRFRETKNLETKEVVWVKKPINIKKAFATVRMKNGEDFICKEFYGYTHFVTSDCYLIITGKEVLLKYFFENSSNNNLFLVKNDRMIRGTDIMDIVGIVESDHIVELEVPEVQTVKTLK